MGKVDLCVEYCLKKEKYEYNIKGIYKDRIIKYKDNDSIMVINLNNNTIERKLKDELIIFNFNEKKCYIKNYNISFSINVINIINNERMFYVYYKIENDSFKIKIKIK